MIHSSDRNGYVMLLTVLVVGTMASAAAISILLLGIGIERNAFAIQQSTQAYYNAWTCAENAISSLQNDLDYSGNHERSFVYGYANSQGGTSYGTTTCKIYPIDGSENTDRTICTEGIFGDFTIRRLEITLSRVLPSTLVDSWEEVDTITHCNPFTGASPVDCGNGDDTDAGEECDDGNTNNNDGCSSVCLSEVCGDGTQQAGEQCDDSNTTSGDGCSSICETEICGDSIIASGEECDDGNTISTDACTASCQNAVCGDTDIWDGVETCDDGNTSPGDGCDENCLLESSSDPSPTDYIGYWNLDETNVSIDAADSSGNGYDGTPENGASVETTDKATLGFTNTASRDFDGIDDYLKMPTSSALFPLDITVSFWAKADSSPSLYDGLVCKTNSSWQKGWGFYFNSSSQVRFFIQTFSSNYASASISPLVWNHILGTFDSSSDTLTIYVNGIAGTSDTYTSSTFNKGERLTIGRCGNDSYNLDGKIDDVRIYDRVLTSDEISALSSGN